MTPKQFGMDDERCAGKEGDMKRTGVFLVSAVLVMVTAGVAGAVCLGNVFTDVNSGTVSVEFCEAIETLAGMGIVNGFPDGTYKPFNTVTRGAMAAIMMRTVNEMKSGSTPTWSQTLPAVQRFQLVMSSGAVLDRETGLVWEQSPSANTHLWLNAQGHCNSLSAGGRKGWRLPTLQELATLVDPTQANPTLPAGHPFSNVQSSQYWSATTLAGDTSNAWNVLFIDGSVRFDVKNFTTLYAWCVRGGQGVDPQ